MSMKFPAKLNNSLSSRTQNAYMNPDDVMNLTKVPAQMKFQCTQAFIEHEGEGKHYLPVFHMRGYIKELTGNFPFNTTSLYFDESDKKDLEKDIIYYPTSDELAHLITVGKFYSEDFRIPPVLIQEYDLPCEISMSVIPPINEMAYEAAQTEEFTSLSEEQQMNLPLFYVTITGTGVSKTNDKLLEYYGIELEDGFDNFYLTAESSGYTDPPLMKYIDEPKHVKQAETQKGADYYITAEEEANMRRDAYMKQQQAEAEIVKNAQAGLSSEIQQVTPEDIMVAESMRNVSRRLEAKFGGRDMSLEALKAAEARREEEARLAEERKLSAPEQQQQQAENKMDFDTEHNNFVTDNREEKHPADIEDKDRYELENKQGADVSDVREQTKIDEAHSRDLARDAALKQQTEAVSNANENMSSDSGKLSEPDTPQMKVEVKMDLNTERNDYVAADRGETDEEKQSELIDDKDTFSVEHMQGADVSDARVQTKVDEAHSRDLARDAAIDAQRRQSPQAVPDNKPTGDDYEF